MFINYNGQRVRVSPIKKEHELEDSWWLWLCAFEFPNGKIKHGFIQGNGSMWAEDTIEIENTPSLVTASKSTSTIKISKAQWEYIGKIAKWI